MSELDAGTVSAPQSSVDIAATVVNDAEHADTSTPESTPTDTRIDTTTLSEESNKPSTAEPTTAAELSAAAKFLEKQGHRLKKEDGRDVWLPAKTVEKMLDRYVEDHRSTWNGERTTIESRAKQYEDHLNTLRASFAGEPRAFIAEIAKVDPRYAAFLEQKAQEQAAPAVETEEPLPDITLADGSQTFSLKGLQAWRDWNNARLEAKIDERLKPIAEREKTERQREESARALEQHTASYQRQMAEAQTWPLFGKLSTDGTLTEFQQAVLAELERDSAQANANGHQPALSLEGAYIRVANGRYTEDDAKRRERLLKEMQAATVAPALSRQSADTIRKPGPRTSQEIAREAIAKLEAGS